MLKRARSTQIEPCKARLTRADLDAGIELGGRYMLAAQRPDGKFDYEVDWTTGRQSADDNAVRQAGAAWGMALLYRETRQPEYRIGIDHVLTRQDGRSGQLGAACLIGLSFLERLAFPEDLTDPAAFRTSLDVLCKVAEEARLPSGGFHAKFDVRTGTFSGRADPYSSGEALLLLARSGLELDIPERVAQALVWAEEDYDLFIAKPRAKEPDPDITKGYYQWSSMTWFALASAGYAPEIWGKRLVEQALWMVDVHRTLSRNRNTGYAYEGIIPAWEWARRTGDHDTARKLACVIHQGLRKLCSWQLGHPLAPAALRAAPGRFHGAVQNHASEPALRIDVTQHQLHALMYARQFGVDTAEHLCETAASAQEETERVVNMPSERVKERVPQKTLSKTPKPQSAAGFLYELTVTHAYKGPNIYAANPAIRCEVILDNLEALNFSTIAEGVRRLIHLLPELDAAPIPKLDDVSWINNITSKKILLAEIAAILTYALMRRVDEWILPVSSGLLANKSGFYLNCEYRRSLDNAKSATALAAELFRSICRPGYDEEKCQQNIANFTRSGRWRREHTSAYLCEVAERRGIPVNPFPLRPAVLGWGNLQKRLRETTTSNTGLLAMRAALNKAQTVDILRMAGVPVPEQITVDSRAGAIAASKSIGYPVVVKPLDGNQGRGVSVKLKSEAAVAAAFDEAFDETKTTSQRVVVESYIAGFDHRLLVIDGEFVAACQRIPGHIVGNGADSVGRLLEILNSDPRRNGDLMYQLKFDFDARRMLEEQGLTLDSIPGHGQIVRLRSRANTSTGGTSKGITECVHPDNRILAVTAARALQLDIAGIDLITTDITRSYKETGGAVCEVNSRPGILDLHVYPHEGSQVLVGSYIMDMLFSTREMGRIPIIAICGSDDRLSHRIAYLLQIAGHDVGLATHAGLWVAGDLISKANAANFDGAKRVLLHPSVSAAVIEITMESMLSEGLGFDFANAAVITSGFAAQIRGSEDATKLIYSSAGALIVDGDANWLLSAAAGQNRLYLSDHKFIDASHEKVIRIVQDDERTLTLESSDRRSVHLPSKDNSPEKIALCIAACDAIGIAPNIIEDALRANFDASRDPMLIRGLSTAFGSVLMATPRNGEEVEVICEIARSWSAPQTPDIIIHMEFEGDSDLRAALDAQLQTGAARVLEAGPTDNDLAALAFKRSDKRAVIITDRMATFRRRLES